MSIDSILYFDIASGREATNQFAPGYPWLLRWLDARVIAVAGFGVTSALTTLAAGPVAALALVSTPHLVKVFGMAWSEPAFLAVMVAFLWALSRERWFPAVSLAAALILLRHAGIAALPVLAWFAWRQAGWQRAALYVTIASLSAVFVPGGRPVAWHLAPWRLWSEGAHTLVTVVLPLRWPVAIAVLAPVYVALGMRRVRVSVRNRELLAVCVAWCASYGLVLVASRTFSDALILFDERLLSPLIAAAILGLCGGVLVTGWWWVAIPAIALRVWVAFAVAERAGTQGQWLSERKWQSSRVVALLRTLPLGTVYSNDGGGLGWVARRRTLHVPNAADPFTGKATEHVDVIARRFAVAVAASHATVLLVPPSPIMRPYALPVDAFRRACACEPTVVIGDTLVFSR